MSNECAADLKESLDSHCVNRGPISDSGEKRYEAQISRMELINASALPRTIHAFRSFGFAAAIGSREVLKRSLGISLDGLAALVPVGRADFAVLLLIRG